MINWSEWLPQLESDLSFATNAKDKAAKIAFTEDVASKLNEAGIDVGVVTEKNADSILNIANEYKSMKNAELKAQEMNTPAVKMIEDRTKKKVVNDVPKTVKIWNKSKFSNDGAYTDIPVIRREDNITLYQGGSDEKQQFWTPDRKYAEKFGEVKSKTGSFYKVDNGNRVTDVYVEVPKK